MDHRPLAAIPVVLLSACAAVPLVVEVGKALLATAASNYTHQYSGRLELLVDTILKTGEEQPGGAIQLDVTVASEDDGQRLRQVDDGDVLYSGDRIRATFSVSEACFVYVVSVDGTGWVTPLVPRSGGPPTAEVEAGVRYEVPSGTGWLQLDDRPGAETLYFVVSSVRRPDLEALMSEFGGLTRPGLRSAEAVPEPAILTRGVAESRRGSPLRVAGRGADELVVYLTSYLTRTGAMVVTRWFRHENRPS